MPPQDAYPTARQLLAEHESVEIVPDDGLDPIRGMLIGVAISAALWAALGGGMWFVLRLPVG